MQQPQLTGGVIRQIIDSVDDELLQSHPTVQVLSVKKVSPQTGSSVDRYRVIVSDGEYFLQAMLGTELNFMIEDDLIRKHSIIVMERFSASFVQERRLIVLSALSVIVKDAEKLGNPQQAQAPPNGGAANGMTSDMATRRPAPSTSMGRAAPVQQNRQQGRNGRAGVYPIESLSPFQNHWTIKALVTQKSDIRTWSNQRGEGKLFSMTLMDDSGEIKATAFNEVVDRLYPTLQEGRVYYVSKARVNIAKKKFTHVQNNYEIALEQNTEVEECHDTASVPTVKFKFVEIKNLIECPKDSVCDVIGVVKEVGPIGEITSRTTSKTITKRELTLVDRSGSSVRLTLWGKQAESFTATDNPVIAFKGIKVGDFGGRSLSMFSSSTMHVDPDIPEAHGLRGWYDSMGMKEDFKVQSISNAMSGSSRTQFNREEIMPLNDVKEKELGRLNKVDSFSTRATIMHIKSDNIAYPACRSEGCNKKVIDINGSWQCEKCNQSWDKPQYRYIVTLVAADYSGQAWLQGFNDVGEIIFGMNADELMEIKERSEAEYSNVTSRVLGAVHNYACTAREEKYNDVARMRYAIQRILPLNFREEGLYLSELLRSEWAR